MTTQAASADTSPTPWEAPEVAPPPPPPPPPPAPPEQVVDWAVPSTWPLWAQLLGLFVGIPLILLLLVPVVAAVRRAVRQRRGGPDRRIGRAWNDLIDEARSLGRSLPAGGTRIEQARALGPAVDAVPAAVRADGMIFGEGALDPGAVTQWLVELRRVRRRLRRETPFGRRMRATFDPRPLFSHQEDIGLHDTTTAPTRKALR